MIQNPILKGFCPDPSIVRAGDDYYIAVSTFEWWPGVKLFHSKDLQNWTQIGAALTRKSQLDMIGDPTSGGVWAPCLSYDNGRFYLVFTDVKTKKGRFYNTHNYLVWTDDIRGEWSEPVYLNSIGFDPSLFHDNDGKKYLLNMVNGFKGVLVQEIDPHNPLLTSERERDDALQKCGHGDLVQIQSGEWYLAHLCARPKNGDDLCVLGRETAIQKLVLDADGWFRLKCGGRYAKNQTESPEEIVPGNAEVVPALDRFVPEELTENGWNRWQNGYCSPRRPLGSDASLTARNGYLRLIGRESLNSLHRVTLAAKRQTALCMEACTRMEFYPEYEEQLAGLAYMYDAMNFYLFGKTVDAEGNPVLALLKSDGGVITDETEPIRLETDDAVTFRARTGQDGAKVTFSYRQNGVWNTVKEDCTTEILTDEHCRGFTGAHFGMYVHDMTGLALHADFEWFYLGEPQEDET